MGEPEAGREQSPASRGSWGTREPGRMGLGPAAGAEVTDKVTDKAVGLAACIVSGEQRPLSCSARYPS